MLDSDCLIGMIINAIESGVFYCTIKLIVNIQLILIALQSVLDCTRDHRCFNSSDLIARSSGGRSGLIVIPLGYVSFLDNTFMTSMVLLSFTKVNLGRE